MMTNEKNYNLSSDPADDAQDERRQRLGELLVENMEEWNRTHDEDEQYFVGSDNPFADAGLPDPEDCMMRAKMLRFIEGEIERRGLSRGQAASLLGVSRSQIRLLREARLSKFSRQTLGMMVAKLATDEAKELVDYMKEWNRSHNEDEQYFVSSDAILSANGRLDPEGHRARTELLGNIVREVKRRGLSRWQIAALLGISWFKVRHLLELRTSKFSLASLLAMTVRLEMADVTVSSQHATSQRGQITVCLPQFT